MFARVVAEGNHDEREGYPAMLKTLVAGLLSMTALVPPALAQDGRSMDRGQWQRDRAERPAPPPAPPRGDAGPAPAPDAPRRWDGGGPPRGDAQAPRPDRPAPPDRAWREGRGPEGAWRREREDARPDADRRQWERRDDGMPRPRPPEGAWRGDRDEPRPLDRPGAPDRVWRSDRADPRRYDARDRPPPPPPAAVWRSGRDDRWDRTWRREPRYDWQRYRAERRSAFRLPRYYAPYGWDRGYRRFGIGMPLAPVLYAPRYWIYDPYAYRLPDAEEPYRWIRYYDDALLVDIEDGTVVDVIHGIFA